MSEDKLKKIVEQTIGETGATSQQDMGKVMGALVPKIKGKADSAVASKLVRELLSSQE